MFQHMVNVLDASQLDQVRLCMSVFRYDKEIRDNIHKFPRFKQYISQHVLQLTQEDLCALYRIFDNDKVFRRRISSVFIERMRKDGELNEAQDPVVLQILRNALRHPDLRD